MGTAVIPGERRQAKLQIGLLLSANVLAAAALVVSSALWVRVEGPPDLFAGWRGPSGPAAESGAEVRQPKPKARESVAADAKPPTPEVGPEGGLTETQRALIWGTASDSEPAVRGGMRSENFDRHYYTSDEWNLHLFRPYIEGLGGAYVGVGSDQGYLMMGWADPEVAFLIDYDPIIVDLHEVYADFFSVSETPEEFISFWKPESRARALQVLRDRRSDQDEYEAGRRAYLRALGRVKRRFTKLVPLLESKGVPSYLTDQSMYERVRSKVTSGRVRPMVVDLNAGQGLAGIASVTKGLGIPVRILYLSNAEQYWKYGENYRQNIGRLGFDDRSVVLRTLSSRRTNGDFRYNVHHALDYQRRMEAGDVRKVYAFVELRRLKGRYDVDISTTAMPGRDAPTPVAAPAVVAAAVAEPPPVAEPPAAPELASVVEPPAPTEPELVIDDDASTPSDVVAFANAPAVVACDRAPPGMACIPGGAFIRGKDDGPVFARPQGKVWLQTFYADVHEVTYGQYKACEEAGQCPKARPKYADFNNPDQPMNGVSWFDARAYCRAHGKDLLTEAQWEKAARGTDGRLFPWGNERATCEKAVIRDQRGRSCGVKKRFGRPEVGKPAPVGSRPPNQYGLYDMAGNSYEWVADWFTTGWERCGEDCAGIDPKGPCEGADECRGYRKRVVRGGSWFWPAYHATTVFRRAHYPDNDPFHHFGFRCGASIEQATALRSGTERG